MSTWGRSARSIAIGSLIAAALVGWADHSSALQAITRYAAPAPDGSGTACSKAAPCLINEAIDNATGGAEVIVTPGEYGSPSAPLTDPLTDAANGSLNIHGVGGKPLPVIYSSADYAIDTPNSRLSNLHLISTGTNVGVSGTYGNHLVVQTSGTDADACRLMVSLSESLCIAAGDTAAAVNTSTSVNQVFEVKNVTAIATGAHGDALNETATGTGSEQVNLSSSILRGAGYDLGVFAGSTAEADINITTTDFKTLAPTAIGGGMRSINSDATDISAAPKFVDLAGLDLREKASSPTVDKGAVDSTSTTDLAGNPRSIGGGPDMGAYEFVPKPAVGALHVSKRSKHSAHLSVKVNPHGAPTKVTMIATRHGHPIASQTTSAGDGSSPTLTHGILHGLSPDKKYQVRAVATNAGGQTSSNRRALHTKR
jgi:hypothetical protein